MTGELRASNVTVAETLRSWQPPSGAFASRILKVSTPLLAATLCGSLWLNQLGRDRVARAAVRGLVAGPEPAERSRNPRSNSAAIEPLVDAPLPTAATASDRAQPEAAQPTELPLWAEREPEILRRLASEPIASVRRGSGGRSLAFKISLRSGIRAYFKPEQEVSSAHWYAEVAAYHLDRALGLHRVPPLVARELSWDALEAAAGSDVRIPELAIGRDGKLRGALIFWLDERLVRAVTPPGWENWIRAEAFPRGAVTPYQRASAYGAALRRAREAPSIYYQSTPRPNRPQLPAELSDMIVFDFLTINYDRFGGDNANILTLGPRGPLIFLDNGDGFSAGPVRRSVLDGRLAPLSRFRRSTVEALRAFDIHAFQARLAREPLAPILEPAALAGLAARREIVLEHIAAQQKRYGDAIFAW